jgi:hypothetical protein
MRAPVALNVRVTDDIADLTALMTRLEEEVPEKRKSPHGGFGSGKGGHGPLASWNSSAAMLVLDVHQGVRELETNIRYMLTQKIRTRGGSDGNTGRALSNLADLLAGADQATVVVTCRKLESWIYRARIILGDLEPISRLPRLPGEGDPACPFCRRKGTLRVRHSTGAVTCLHPGCTDSAGNRPVGRIEVGSFSAEPMLAWADGTTGVAGAVAA